MTRHANAEFWLGFNVAPGPTADHPFGRESDDEMCFDSTFGIEIRYLVGLTCSLKHVQMQFCGRPTVDVTYERTPDGSLSQRGDIGFVVTSVSSFVGEGSCPFDLISASEIDAALLDILPAEFPGAFEDRAYVEAAPIADVVCAPGGRTNPASLDRCRNLHRTNSIRCLPNRAPLPAGRTSRCEWRAEFDRLEITPTGLLAVLAETTTDPQHDLFEAGDVCGGYGTSILSGRNDVIRIP